MGDRWGTGTRWGHEVTDTTRERMSEAQKERWKKRKEKGLGKANKAKVIPIRSQSPKEIKEREYKEAIDKLIQTVYEKGLHHDLFETLMFFKRMKGL
jgi:hypothetical protein